MRRTFSKSERIAVSLVSGGNGEADHIKPFSKGGETAVENCQLIDRTLNQKKGDSEFVPRKWQKEFFREWDKRPAGQPFMLVAIPGGGKTMAALEVCRRWMAAGTDRRVIVVVPTDNLREQWRDEAEKFGISLQSKEFGTDFKDGFQGGVVTYHLVANQPLVFRKLCSVAPTMVVFDEIHHCGDDAHFGIGITQAFELSKEKLLLSGTPWKTDGTPIPYVTYDGSGFAVGDFFYDYPRALNEDVVRYLVFDYAKGLICNDVTGQTEVLSQEISDVEAQRRLKKILDPDGDYVREQIQSAHRKLVELRKTIPDAAAMAVCIDQCHAMKVARTIQDVTGVEPSVIVSDTEIENDSVKAFRKSKTEWLVSVKKVSEGTDIKRLQVLCFLTNVTSELFFRQIVGRVSRIRGMEDGEAYVYLPADPRLIRCAQNIQNAQVRSLNEDAEREKREFKDREQGEFEFESYSTYHDGTDLAIIGSERLSLEEYREIERASEAVGISMQKALVLKRMFSGNSQATQQDRPIRDSKEERMDKLRKKCGKTAYALAAETARRINGDSREIVKQIHGRFKKQETMSEEELVSKLDWLTREMNKVMNQ